MKFSPAVAVAFLGLLVLPQLEAAEFRAAVGSWRYDLSGSVIDRGETYDFEKDFGLQTSGRRSVLLEFDTNEGWPDFAASYSRFGAQGERTESSTGGIGPIPIPGPAQTRRLAADADFSDYDLTARIPLRLGRATLGLGLSAKRLSGDILIDDSNDPPPRRQNFDEVFPQLHAQLRWPLARFLVLTGTAQGIEYRGSKATEYRAAVEIRLWKRALLEAGWQEKHYEITVDSYRLDARLDGALLRFGFLLN